MKTYWVDDEGQMRAADVPEGVKPDGIDIGTPCAYPKCTTPVVAMDLKRWTATCERGHTIPLPDAFVQARGGYVSLYRKGSSIAPTYAGHPVAEPPR